MKRQTQAVLDLLRSWPYGVTQQDAVKWVGTYRLAAQILELRRDGFDIETVKDGHADGWHARYVLHEAPVQLAAFPAPADSRPGEAPPVPLRAAVGSGPALTSADHST